MSSQERPARVRPYQSLSGWGSEAPAETQSHQAAVPTRLELLGNRASVALASSEAWAGGRTSAPQLPV